MSSFLPRALYERIMRANPAPVGPCSVHTVTVDSTVPPAVIAELVRKAIQADKPRGHVPPRPIPQPRPVE